MAHLNGSNGTSSRLNGATNGAARRALFGELCLGKGFIDNKALDKALTLQRSRDSQGESHKLLGIILLEMGAISSEQLIDILKHMNTSASGRVRTVS
jgi:hypothetical protein